MPRIDVTELDRELRQKRFRPLYVITGAEHHLALTALREIKRHIAPVEGPGLSLKSYSARESFRPEDAIETLKTVSMLGERPLAIIREGEALSDTALKVLADYARSPIESSTLVVVGEKLDGRSRFMEAASKSGAIVECKPLYQNKVPFWINVEVKKEGRQISQEAARFLADMVGNDLGQLSQAIERIILYVGDRKIIDVKDVNEAIAKTHQHTVFEFADAVGAKDLPKALSLLRNILENGGSPILVLNMLARHFRILAKAKEISGRMRDVAEIAKYLGVNPFFVSKYTAQVKNFSASELRNGFRTLHRCDRELKSSRLNHERIFERAFFAIMK